MHLLPNSTELNHSQVHNHLPTLQTPRHPRLFQPLAEHRLARRLRHSTTDGEMALPIATIVPMPQPIRQVIVRRLELLPRTVEPTPCPQCRRRMQHPKGAVRLALEPPTHLPRPGMALPCPPEQLRSHAVDVLADVPVVHHPLPLQELTGTTRVLHQLEHRIEIVGRMMTGVGDVG